MLQIRMLMVQSIVRERYHDAFPSIAQAPCLLDIVIQTFASVLKAIYIMGVDRISKAVGPYQVPHVGPIRIIWLASIT